MDMLFWQLFINGIIAGSIYALVASGFSLIYSTNKIMHFAHGITVVLSSYMVFLLFAMLHAPFMIACLGAIAFAVLFGFAINSYLYQILEDRKSSHIILLIASLGILIFFQNMLILLFGASIKSINYIEVRQGMDFLGAIITPLQIVIICTAIVLLIALYLFMKKSTLGRNMRAIADNKELAQVSGINAKKISNYSFMIGSGIAGIAGILIGLEQTIDPAAGTGLIVKGFTGAIIGGIGSVPGSIFGSYILGLVENFGIWFLPSGYKDAIAFVLLFIFLLFMPEGLFGNNKGGRR